ncbi:MAG: iron-containing alcohol dehydrogenase [Desulfovermiculus sp.]|nr:iron-containing alcohol dehydrogenase [Desulfovermiculus sp.]
MISFDKANVGSCLSPRQILLGDGASTQIREILENWQITKGRILIVADKEVVELGLVDKVREPLAAHFDVACFDQIVGEPTLTTAENLVNIARQQPYSAVVGVGGGSAIDMSKLAAGFAVNTGDVHDYIGVTSFKKTPLPLIAVPTTAGTGAEATAVSMLSIEGKKTIVLSPQLVPLAAVLDSTLTLSLPSHVTAATGLDALSHALEGFMSTKANPFTDSQAMSTISVIARWLKTAFVDGSNIEARRAMIYAAYTGGLCLNAGVVIGHSVGYTISNRTNLPHGVSCAMALPYTIAFNLQMASDRLSWAAQYILGGNNVTGEDLARWVSDLSSDLNMPQSLEEIGIKEADLSEMVEECLDKYPRPTNPTQITREQLIVFYQKMYTGDVKGCLKAFRST